MVPKRVLRPERLRRIPRQFSWIDQRLVRERYVQRCDAPALALYLLLLTVGDDKGLSYYGEATLCRLLSIPPARVRQARQDLIDVGLIAYEAPLYQVLSLDPPPAPRVAQPHTAQGHLAAMRAQLAGRGEPNDGAGP